MLNFQNSPFKNFYRLNTIFCVNLVCRFWTQSSTLHLLLKKDSGFASSNIFSIFEQNPHVWPSVKKMCLPHTGKSLSEALIFASPNPQYNNRVFIELKVQYMKIPSIVSEI